MKHKMSISVEEGLILKILQRMRENRLFRSKSHVIEDALYNYFEGRK